MARISVLLIKAIVSVLILAAFMWKLDFESVVLAIKSVYPAAIVAAVLVILIQSVMSAGRLAIVVRVFGHHLDMLQSVRFTIESMFFSQTFISFLGGDALRIWRIHKTGLTAYRATNAVILDRLIGIIANHLCLLATLPLLLSLDSSHQIRFALILLGAIGLGGIGLLLFLGFVPLGSYLVDRLPRAFQDSKIVSLALDLSTIGRHLVGDWNRTVPMGILGFLTAVGNCVIFFLILWGIGVEMEVAVYCGLLAPAVLEIAMLPISIAGWGVREAVAVVAFGSFGVTPDRALAASIVFGILLAGVSLLGGIVWLLDEQRFRVRQ